MGKIIQNNTTSVKTGGWFLPMLTLIFVIAKILGLINWSWWLVFSPMLLSVGIGIILIIGLIITYFFIE